MNSFLVEQRYRICDAEKLKVKNVERNSWIFLSFSFFSKQWPIFRQSPRRDLGSPMAHSRNSAP